jgi:hypothetical protein
MKRWRDGKVAELVEDTVATARRGEGGLQRDETMTASLVDTIPWSSEVDSAAQFECSRIEIVAESCIPRRRMPSLVGR